jgi:acyl carrier protein
MKEEANVEMTVENSKDLFKLGLDELTWVEVIMEIETAYGIGIDEIDLGFKIDDTPRKLPLDFLVEYVESKTNQG